MWFVLLSCFFLCVLGIIYIHVIINAFQSRLQVFEPHSLVTLARTQYYSDSEIILYGTVFVDKFALSLSLSLSLKRCSEYNIRCLFLVYFSHKCSNFYRLRSNGLPIRHKDIYNSSVENVSMGFTSGLKCIIT